MVNPKQIEEDVLFWLGQIEPQHMAFLVLGLQDSAFREEARRLLRAYEEASAKRDIRGLLALTTPSQSLKKAALEASKERWIGFLYPSFYEHMIQEIDYALALARRDLNPREVACFWAKERSDVGAIIAKGLDPSEGQLALQALRHHAVLRDLYAACRRPSSGNLSPNVLQATVLLDQFLQSANITNAKKILTPMMIQHEIMEGQYAQAALQKMYLPPS